MYLKELLVHKLSKFASGLYEHCAKLFEFQVAFYECFRINAARRRYTFCLLFWNLVCISIVSKYGYGYLWAIPNGKCSFGPNCQDPFVSLPPLVVLKILSYLDPGKPSLICVWCAQNSLTFCFFSSQLMQMCKSLPSVAQIERRTDFVAKLMPSASRISPVFSSNWAEACGQVHEIWWICEGKLYWSLHSAHTDSKRFSGKTCSPNGIDYGETGCVDDALYALLKAIRKVTQPEAFCWSQIDVCFFRHFMRPVRRRPYRQRVVW